MKICFCLGAIEFQCNFVLRLSRVRKLVRTNQFQVKSTKMGTVRNFVTLQYLFCDNLWFPGAKSNMAITSVGLHYCKVTNFRMVLNFVLSYLWKSAKFNTGWKFIFVLRPSNFNVILFWGHRKSEKAGRAELWERMIRRDDQKVCKPGIERREKRTTRRKWEQTEDNPGK